MEEALNLSSDRILNDDDDDLNTSSTSCNLLAIISILSSNAIIRLRLPNMFPHFSRLDLLIAIFNAMLNSKGAIASPFLKTC